MAVEAEGFLSSLVGLTGMPFFEGNDVRLLNNGDEFYPAMLDAIRGARQSVTIEAYIYWDGRVGVEFAEALAARARAGVIVKILLEGSEEWRWLAVLLGPPLPMPEDGVREGEERRASTV